MTFDRRAFNAALAVVAIAAPGPVRADAPPPPPQPIDWGGEGNGLSAHVLVVGDEVMAFYWRGAVATPSNSRASPDGRRLTFNFPGGHAQLTVTGPQTATLTIVDAKGQASLALRRN